MSKTDSADSFDLDLLDFLFTFALGFGMTPEVLNAGLKGLLSEVWYTEGRWPNTGELFDFLVFFVGFLNLALSWFGYHVSVRLRPLKYKSPYGMWRFLIDVVLVIVYGIILLEYKRFGVVLVWLIFVYALFPLWDFLKVREYQENFRAKPDPFLRRYRRECVSGFAAVLFLLTGLLYYYQLNRRAILTLAGFVTVFYRINKGYPVWERIFGITAADA